MKSREIQSELDLEVASICHRSLRLMIKDPPLKVVRKRLDDSIKDDETKNWYADSTVTPNRIEESDLAELDVKKEMHKIKQSLLQYVHHNF